MPINETKVIEILKQKTEIVEARYEGYSKDLFSTVAEIVTLERSHILKKMSIVEKIEDKIDLTADELYRATKDEA